MKEIQKKFKLAKIILITLVKDRIHYPSRLLADTISVIARFVVLIILYSYVFKLNGGTINNTTFLVAAWSMFFYFSFMILGMRSIAKWIMQDVQTGNVEVLFSKPVHYLFYRFWWQIGTGVYSFFVITIVGIIGLYFTIGFPATFGTAVFLFTVPFVFLGGILLSFIIYSIVGVLAFWIQDINPVFWIVDKAVMILGGSYLPVALFPPIMYKIALYSPFGASQFLNHTVYTSWQTNWYQLMGIQILWILLLGVILFFMFKGAKKKVSVNGG
jgi:ABC-2 type transport system permease protein